MAVHVIDDDPAVRQLLHKALASASLSTLLYSSAQDFLDVFDPDTPGCIVLDLRMPGIGGLELLKRLRDDGVEMPIIIVSGHVDVPDAVQSMKLGAIDLLQKPFKMATLVDLVRRALQSSAESFERQASRDEIRRRFSTLTPRELELVKHVVSGSSSKQIAATLHISIRTVSNHRAHLMDKVKAANAADLSRLAVAAGIIESAVAQNGHKSLSTKA